MNDQVVLGVEEPKVLWMTLMAAIAVGLAVIGAGLTGSRKPRIMATDDFTGFVGLPVVTRVSGGRSRRTRTTRAQLQQLAVAATSGSETTVGSRIVLGSTGHDSVSRRTAMGLAAALVEQGRRVVLVDAQVDRPLLSLRLGGWNSAGIATNEGSGPLGSRRASTPADGSTNPNDFNLEADEQPSLELRNVTPRRLPIEARGLLGEGGGRLRFVSGGPFKLRSRRSIDVNSLKLLDETVTVLVLAPPAGGQVAVSPLFEWADTVLVAMRTGQTTTVNAENSASTVRMFGSDSSAIVLINS
ncbi:MAG TPA: hypothetical protein VL068_14895 [Microthrixaceae bacterium]|nr:hypothetical protein [Microthrixaceae bacterium]